MSEPRPMELEGERGPPPYFTGRTEELAAMQKRLRMTLNNRSSAENGLLLITGVPGVGKTQLANHFLRQQADVKNVETLAIGTTATSSGEGLLALIGETMGAKDQFLKAAGIDDKLAGAKAGVPGVSGSFTVDVHRPDANFFHMLHATRTLRAWRSRALVLVIDELQNLDSHSTSQLRTLHEGHHGCPIFTIGAGLPHTRAALGRCGVSRTSHIRLGLLSQDETVHAVFHGLANIGIDACERTATILADASLRFPHHVHAHIEAALAVHERRGEVNSPEAVAETLAAGRKSRENYYDDRIAACECPSSAFYPVVNRMTATRSQGLAETDAEQLLGKDTLASAIERGVLSRDVHGTVSFSIPSFHTYMVEQAAQHERFVRHELQPR